ncbi:riboflavin kinase [Kineococcus rhizosphaerae]|uniref:riboflavin kinase n=1 Tax=Kineococcus rhizosphaerae TaxID=559628 RepID=A0A2T0R266_9ACTN|nr:riboflavin kinase [Kineococcus rhizosphaerae]PRY13603.1 riboflavin kinase [Kineococcus rhizosphaerae]
MDEQGPAAPLEFTGVVERGDERGRTLGFPTANLPLPPGLDPEDGVWAGIAQVHGSGDVHVAAVSVGTRPTYYRRDGVRLLEAHLLDFSGDLLGARLTVHLYRRLRNQRRFDGPAELVTQLEVDVRAVRAWAREQQVRGRRKVARGTRTLRRQELAQRLVDRSERRTSAVAARVAAVAAAGGTPTHEDVAQATGVPVDYLRWRYPDLNVLGAAPEGERAG